MCWSNYLASSKPLPTGPVAGEGEDSLRVDSVVPGYEQPLEEGLRIGPRHFSLRCVYLVNVRASCEFSCGVDSPAARSELRTFIRQQLDLGNQIELVCSHVDCEEDDLAFTVAMTPEELPAVRIERRTDSVHYNPPLEYEVATTEFPLEGHADVRSPRLIQFVADRSESTYAALDPRVVRSR